MDMMTTKAAQAAAAREETRRRLIEAGLELAKRSNFATLRRDEVGAAASMSPAIVNHAFGTMANYRDAVMEAAVTRKDVVVIAQGLVSGHPIALAASPALRAASVNAFA